VSEYSKKVRSALDAAVDAIGGSPRDGQIEMAEAVANALSDRHHLLVQAGTGTGSSSLSSWQKSIGSNCHLGPATSIS
jgi:ATP-dependent DNA helicase DinG